MSQPKKYLVRIQAAIAIEDLDGREVVESVDFPAGWGFFKSPAEIRENISGKFDAEFAELERRLEVLEQMGVKAPLEKLRRQRKR